MAKTIYITILAASMALALASCGKKGGADGDGQTEGRNIVETGTLAAVNVKSFTVARSRYWWEIRIIGLAEHGAEVNAGDSIIQLDPKDVNKQIVDNELELETALAALHKMEVDQQVARNAATLNIKSQEASFDLKKIELESSAFESERYRKIKQLEFEQARITLAKERRRQALSRIVDSCNMKIQQIRVRRIKDDLANFHRMLAQLTIRTPVTGVFQVGRNPRTRAQTVVGDMASPNFSVGNVPELKHMKVETSINELDFLKIHAGQKVAVRLDAMPSVVFDGQVAYIGKLCRPREDKAREKVFDVEVTIDRYDARLKPGMTVSCEFLKD